MYDIEYVGGEDNPLTGEPYSEKYYEIKKKIDKLPSSDPKVQEELKKKFLSSDVLIVRAETGAGKGVVVTPSLLKFMDYKAKIVSTQPRSPNTEVAKFVAEVLDTPVVGKHVGYAYRFNKHANEDTLLTYMTDGLLVNYFYNDPSILRCDVIVIDEVHERNISIDMLLLMCKKAMTNIELIEKRKKAGKNPLKLVIMSATMDPDFYANYYGNNTKLKVDKIDIKGRSFPVESIFLKSEVSVEEYPMVILDKVREIIKSKKPGDILVFLPATREINQLCQQINTDEFKKEVGETVVCYGLYRGVSDEMKELILSADKFKSQSGNPTRKIVMSTNIAESGVTVDGVLFVIDSGRRYQVYFDPVTRIDKLENEFISRSEIEQRMGRAGRTAAGTCYHIYTKEQFDGFPYQKTPSIHSEKIDDLILNLLKPSSFTEDNSPVIKDIPKLIEYFGQMIEPPTKTQMEYSLKFLTQMKVVDPVKLKTITELGVCVSMIPLDVELSFALLAAEYYGVMEDVKQITAMLSLEPNISKWFKEPALDSPKHALYKKEIKKYSSDKADIFAFQKMFSSFKKVKSDFKSKKWANEKFLNLNLLVKTKKILRQLNESIKSLPAKCFVMSDIAPAKSDSKNVLLSFVHGFYLNIAEKKKSIYELKDGSKVELKAGQRNQLTKLADKIMYISAADVLGKRGLSGLFNISKSSDFDDLIKELNK